jgi:TatA/E family protein of Tat protein translocase
LFNIGSQEILIILLLVFLLFGPKHIPEMAHSLGKGLGDLRRALQGVEDEVRRTAREIRPTGDTVPRARTILPPPLADAAPPVAPGAAASGPDLPAPESRGEEKAIPEAPPETGSRPARGEGPGRVEEGREG